MMKKFLRPLYLFEKLHCLQAALDVIVEEFSQNILSGRKEKIIPATDKAKTFVAEALRQGLVLLLSGVDHNVISITPPFLITEKEIHFCIKTFDKIFQKIN